MSGFVSFLKTLTRKSTSKNELYKSFKYVIMPHENQCN